MIKDIQKINVLIDTNIFIRASMNKETRSDMLSLINFANSKKVSLIISEIVMDELKKYKSNLDENLGVEISKMSTGIRKIIKEINLWNEMNDLEKYIIDKLYEYKGEKYKESNEFIEHLENLIEKKKIKTFKPNFRQYYERQREFTKGEKALRNSNDIHIMDFIKEFHKKKKGEDVCFVTENKHDFFEKDVNGNYVKNEKGCYIIKDLQIDNVYGFVNLQQVIAFIKKQTGEENE